MSRAASIERRKVSDWTYKADSGTLPVEMASGKES